MPGAKFTPINEQDFANFVRRGFGALKPVRGMHHGEICYDFTVGPLVRIRVLTSIRSGSGQAADVGGDAIRCALTTVSGAPLTAGKWSKCNRVEKWRDNLRYGIGELLEKYEDNPEYWEERSAHYR